VHDRRITKARKGENAKRTVGADRLDQTASPPSFEVSVFRAFVIHPDSERTPRKLMANTSQNGHVPPFRATIGGFAEGPGRMALAVQEEEKEERN
jgi:hypothetical protein